MNRTLQQRLALIQPYLIIGKIALRVLGSLLVLWIDQVARNLSQSESPEKLGGTDFSYDFLLRGARITPLSKKS